MKRKFKSWTTTCNLRKIVKKREGYMMNKMEQHRVMEMTQKEKRLETELQTENLTRQNRKRRGDGT